MLPLFRNDGILFIDDDLLRFELIDLKIILIISKRFNYLNACMIVFENFEIIRIY